MESIISTITSNRILLIIIILIISLLVYSILKQLVKIIVIMIIALALYLGYINYKGDKTLGTIEEYLKRSGMEFKELEKKKDAVSKILDSAETIKK